MGQSTASVKLQTVSILGCGWYGLELAKALVAKGYTVKGSSTTAEKLPLLSSHQIQPFLVSFEQEEESYDPLFFQTDVLFICIPPKRSSSQQSAYLHKIQRICNAATLHKTSNLVFISSTSVYGDHNEEVTEISIPIPETASGNAILEAENLLKKQSGFHCTILRFAGLVGPGRHPGRFFAGKKELPNGQAPINLIHLTDCIGISLQLIEQQLFGHTINACSPDHPAKQDFYVAATLNAGLPLPEFKNERLKWKLISTIHTPLLNYTYQLANWKNWLNEDNLL
ncbi:SDR family oxidoreductase [Pedobacter heparinus]|uniref:SDR family oxidoreductase n=1 Tax=Pedobacter heparinus TaxID=984 RepID=UPI00293149EF|nr:SDR family oxidoreductase [Pedobacter heparinus]